jgi:hypothetical protein
MPLPHSIQELKIDNVKGLGTINGALSVSYAELWAAVY